MSETSNFALITGPNMSGKSTYLRQVGQAVVMAQAGCFVPASFASLAPFERLHARAVHCGGGSSDKETSSFMVEMVETAQILRTLGHRSLVLMDELGRYVMMMATVVAAALLHITTVQCIMHSLSSAAASFRRSHLSFRTHQRPSGFENNIHTPMIHLKA